jgi:phosphatidate phosphatase APP1
MAQSRLAGWDGTNGDGGGGRRKKVYGYLKAANELRQSYAAQWTAQRNGARGGYDEEYYMTTPGAFSDVEIARAGDEEMVIFPSYARRLAEGQQGGLRSERRRDSDSSIDDYHRSSSSSDEEERWDEYEAENAVVDVDVRGWIYVPHRQPMSRKQRLMITAARKLSGVPAPNVVVNDAAGSGSGSEQGLAERVPGKGEEEAANQEVQSIINKAESDADAAWKGNASEGATGRLGRSTTSTPEPSQMTRDELSLANAHLMERLQPFLCNPMAEMPVTAFFFNGEKSQSRNIVTDESGHFSLRVGLPFVPTHVRVLASENLSTAKEVDVLEPTGVSVISDIDDTVKHSAIASGAREIFRNTFVRELGELTIDGVSEWYSKLAEKGVEFHYVSSAPWQLYPLLERYFKLVGLPPGSFHLKQYSGMLQGIFEPTSERKRSSLDRILRDFPARKFILVGDSGEADLEVYTDIALENPDRILGIFIRDITTPSPKKFFEKSSDHLEPDPLRSRSTGQLGGEPDTAANRPVLPPRPPREEPDLADSQSLDNADLIDLRDDEERNAPAEKPANSRTPPGKPAKPSTLRTVATADAQESAAQREVMARKPIPPVPPRRGTAAEASGSTERQQPQGEDGKSTPSESYIAPVKNAVSSVSSALPAASEYLPVRSAAGQGTPAKKPPPVPPPRRTNTAASTASTNSTMTQKQQSYPAAVASTALQYASDRLNWGPPQGGSTATSSSVGRANTNNSVAGAGEADYSNPASPVPLPSKREELWRRRWERASDMLGKQGIVLGSWRVGGDVQDVCLWLVDEGLKGPGDQTQK